MTSCYWVLLADDAPGQGPIPIWLLFAALGVVFYLVMIRPQRREAAETKNMLSNLKPNDKVVTIGGIHGTVVSAGKDSDTVVIRVDDNTKVRMTRSAVARIVDPNEKKGESKDGAKPAK
ncbi:MAG: preprotein translocase subunit YajC [Pirellulaceae bacterium]